MTYEVDNLLDILHRAHCDNAKQAHYAKRPLGSYQSTMPATSFVYEFFIYNSIYQYNWQATVDSDRLTPWPRDDTMSESGQQNSLESFIRTRCRADSTLLGRALDPLAELSDLSGNWTKVTADARIRVEDGERFFKKLSTLSEKVRAARSGGDLNPTKALFELISACRYYVYLVRNNIFHGSKTIGEIYEPSQRRRIEVYDLFVKCLVSLFFLAVGRTKIAADFVQLPIFAPGQERVTLLDQSEVIDLVVQGLLKPEDSRLISKFFRVVPFPELPPGERAALFYPSAGIDVLTPVILGLPFCSQFYFYERSPRHTARKQRLQSAIQRITRSNVELERNDGEYVWNCEYAGLRRVIHHVHRDNKDFLDMDVDLCFYFHRGDSWGEGGSGQEWDSDLLKKLMPKVARESVFHILTDGEPGGILEAVKRKLHPIHIPITERDRKYFGGSLTAVEFESLIVKAKEKR